LTNLTKGVLNVNLITQYTLINQLGSILLLYYEFIGGSTVYNNLLMWCSNDIFISISLGYIILALFIIIYVYKYTIVVATCLGNKLFGFNNFINLFIFSWWYLADDKLESLEEVCSLIIL
jgi:hypothetical protein